MPPPPDQPTAGLLFKIDSPNPGDSVGGGQQVTVTGTAAVIDQNSPNDPPDIIGTVTSVRVQLGDGADGPATRTPPPPGQSGPTSWKFVGTVPPTTLGPMQIRAVGQGRGFSQVVTNSDQRTVNVTDVTPPDVVIDPVPLVTGQGTITISGTATDQQSTVSSVSWFFTNLLFGTATLDAPGSKSTTWHFNLSITPASVPAGTSTVAVGAQDSTGNVSEQKRVAVIDITPPDLAITVPADNSTFSPDPDDPESNATITVKGTAADRQTSVSKVEWTLDGNTWSIANMDSPGWATWSARIKIPPLGPRTISVRATDNAAPRTNTVTKTVSVEVLFQYKLEEPTSVLYLSELLSFATYRVLTRPDPDAAHLDRVTLVAQFFQPLDVVTSDESVHQARTTIEVLRTYLKTLQVPEPVRIGLAAAEAGYRQKAYQTLLTNIGTSYEELRLARTAADETRRELAERLGLDLAPSRPDLLDSLLFTKLEQITEAELEKQFGLVDTTRDPLAVGPDPDLLTWRRQHLRALWIRQDYPANTQSAVPQLPLVDPDLIGPEDLILSAPQNPNPASDLWQERSTWVSGQLELLRNNRQQGEGDKSRFDRLVDAALGDGTLTGLLALQEKQAGGHDIGAALQEHQLPLDAFSRLMRLRALAQSAALLDSEWEEVYSILVQVQKVRRYADWRAQEGGRKLTVGPDYFRLRSGQDDFTPSARAAALPQWRATVEARHAWEDRLRARVEQDREVKPALLAAIAATEESTLPVLRDALLAAIGAIVGDGLSADDLADLLTERLLIDVKGSGRQQTTRLEQAIETLQGVLFALRTGRFAELPAQLGPNPMAQWRLAEPRRDFDLEWAWIGSYATWQAAVLVLLYPENDLKPTLRETPPATKAFRDMVGDLGGRSRVTPEDARTAAQTYLDALRSQLPPNSLPPDLKLTDQVDEPFLMARRDLSKTLYGNLHGAPPPAYLLEICQGVPMYLASRLQQSREFTAALDWFRTVYAYHLPLDQRKIDYGLELEHGIASKFERPLKWLLESLNPHDIAQTRADTYTRFTVQSIVRCLLDFADAEFAAETSESLPRARALYLEALDLLGVQELKPQDQSYPANPVPRALRQHAKLNLFKMRDGRNIAGMLRQSDVGGTSGALVAPPQPTPYRYAVLMDRAKQLVTLAQQVESAFQSALEKRDAEAYNLLKAGQDLSLARAQVQLQDARIVEARDGVALAGLQRDRAQLQQDTYQGWLNTGQIKSESDLIQNYRDAGTYRDWIAFMDAGITMAQAMTTAASGGFLGTGASGGWGPTAVVTALASAKGAMTGLLVNAETSAQINAVNASYERRAQEWQLQKNLAEKDAAIADQQIQAAKDHVFVAIEEREVAQLQADHAQATANFLANKFTNVELYEWMSGVLMRVYSYFLQQATAVARLAQSQLAFERQERQPSFIQADYWQAPTDGAAAGGASGQGPNRLGLTGSARLLQDLYQLDQYAFDTNKRKLQLTQTLSLARLVPLEFQRFRETGVLLFATPMELFDRDFPGHYLRLIRRVRTSVIALIPPNQGIRATLAASGISRVTLGDELFRSAVVRRDPESVALTSPSNATGLFELDTQPEMLLPFEGMGVDAAWELQMPRAANPFDFDTIADVLISIDYTALNSFDYRQQVTKRLNASVSIDRPFSFRQQFADPWYDLHNPERSDKPMAVRFRTRPQDFPPTFEDLKIQQVLLYFARVDGSEFEVSVKNLQFTPQAAGEPVGGPATSIDGVISTRRGNAGSWQSMAGLIPFGDWELTLPDTPDDGGQIRNYFKNEQVRDILFVLTCSGRTPDWPQ